MAAGDGLISMTPSSIAHSGTSATINADGGVDFTAVTSLSLNGVFTSDYDNYLLVISETLGTGTAESLQIRFRAAGTDATGSNYTWQLINATGSTVSGSRSSSQTLGRIANSSASSPNANGHTVHIYGPYLAQPTAWRSVDVNSNGAASILDAAGTHSLSTSYDGCTILIPASSISGTVHVFGYEE
jgi:hypothetical protein